MFCRDMGWKEDEDAVEAREGVCSMIDIVCVDKQAKARYAGLFSLVTLS